MMIPRSRIFLEVEGVPPVVSKIEREGPFADKTSQGRRKEENTCDSLRVFSR